MRFESKGHGGSTKNHVSLSEHDSVDEISDKLTRARRLFSLRDYDSCEELARQVLDIDPENPTAKALFQLTGINRPRRKRLQKIVDPQLPREDQIHPDKVEAEPKRWSIESDNVPSEPSRGKLFERVIDPQIPEEKQTQLQSVALTGHPSGVNSDSSPLEHQLPLSKSSKAGEGNKLRGASTDEAVLQAPPHPFTAATPDSDNFSSAEDLREKTIAALVEFLNEKNKSSSQLAPQAAEEESPKTGLKVIDAPDISPPQTVELRPKINDEASIQRAREEDLDSPKLWGDMAAVRTPENRAEDYMASAVSYYHERRLPEALAAAREALRLAPGHNDAREFVNFVQKRLDERKKRKWWAVAMLLIWLLLGLVILTYRGRNGTSKEGLMPLNSEQHTPPNKQRSDPNDTSVQTASPLPAQSKPLTKSQDKSSDPTRDGFPTTTQMKSSSTELSPEDVVKTFYTRAAADDFAGAWELAGPGFRQQLKSFERFRNAQRSLQSIEFLRAEKTSQTERRATVMIETIATHTSRTDHCKGSLSLVKKGPNQSWVLNWANGIHCESQPRSSVAGSGK